MKNTVDRTPPKASATAISTRYLVVCSGVDKVGKSTLCINLAIALARTGKRVCIIDTDPGVSNAHRSLGLSPGYSLASVARQECNIRDAISNGPEGIQLLLDGGYRKEAKSLQVVQQRNLLKQIRNWQQDLDIVLVDMTADADDLGQWMTIADSMLVLLAPHSQVLSETFSLLSHLSPPCIKKPMHVVINRSDGARQAESIFHKFGAAAKKYLDTELMYCGYIANDDSIRNSVALQYPVALYSRDDPSCAGFFELAGVLERQWAETASCGVGLAEGFQWMTTEPASQLFTPANTANNPDKAQFLQMPALADELIDRGALGPEELQQVIEALLATAHHEFPATFRRAGDKAKVQPAGNNSGQQSLLEKLRQSRDTNHSLDQRLYDFAKER